MLYLTSNINLITCNENQQIKIVLAENDKTNKWLAKQLDKSEVTVSRWVTNEVQPSLETMAQIAQVLK